MVRVSKDGSGVLAVTGSQLRPIGVFDSGVGGLTVVRALREELPSESFVYLGDTARVPYGTKSPLVVSRYALNAGRFLVSRGARALVVACNTASAVAVEVLREALAVPVFGVIEPGARMAAKISKSGRIGVIGTEATITSQAYTRAIARFRPTAEVRSVACPLFVPFAEEGLGDHPAARMMAEEYLGPLRLPAVDSLVLGCTHYPALRSTIAAAVGPDVEIIDSASAVATEVAGRLRERGMLELSEAAFSGARSDRFYSTDTVDRFVTVGAGFLGAPLGTAEQVDL